MKKNLVLIAILATLTLSGCSTMPGVFNGLDKDPMRTIILICTDKPVCTLEQYRIVAEMANRMRKQIEPQISSAMEAGVSLGVPSAVASAAGGAIEGPIAAAGAGVIGAGIGFIGGIATASYANVWPNADAVEHAIRDREAAGDEQCRGLHATASFIRGENSTDSPASGLLMLMQQK